MNSNNRTPYIVAFPHPGDEHLVSKPNRQAYDPEKVDEYINDEKRRKKYAAQQYKELISNDAGTMWWNNSEHKRKFIRATGHMISKNDFDIFLENKTINTNLSELCFWGELEYPTYFEKIPYTTIHDTRYPTYIHTPVPQKRLDILNKTEKELQTIYDSIIIDTKNNRLYEPSMGKQNTDPYVFGDNFMYSCCKQVKNRKPSKLQNLFPGDIIVYYSLRKNEIGFSCLLDTVFVVEKVVGRYKRNDYKEIQNKVSELYFQNVILPIHYGCGNSIDDEGSYTLYKAATPSSPVNGMFSYFPCKEYSEKINCGFPRYEIKDGHLTDAIQIKSQQGFAIKSTDDSDSQYNLWLSLTQNILNSGYNLGTHVPEPVFE